MNILLTNDDGYKAPGIIAAYRAIRDLGHVDVVAPRTERSACSHTITLDRPITVETVEAPELGKVYAVEGTPADCVRLAVVELLRKKVELVVSGVNRGANSGVDVFYSGTIAGAREGAIQGVPAIAVSQAVHRDRDIDWPAASAITGLIIRQLLEENLPGPGFWSVNLPPRIPADAADHIRRVPVDTRPAPLTFHRLAQDDGRVVQFDYGASYWVRDARSPTDYSTIRDGAIAVSAIPLYGRF